MNFFRSSPEEFFRQIFGGNERVKMISDFLHRLHAGGVRLYILSHGYEHEIAQALAWLGVRSLFEGELPAGRIHKYALAPLVPWADQDTRNGAGIAGRGALQRAGGASKAAFLSQLVAGCAAADKPVMELLFVDDDRANFPEISANAPSITTLLLGRSGIRQLAFTGAGTVGLAGLLGYPLFALLITLCMVATWLFVMWDTWDSTKLPGGNIKAHIAATVSLLGNSSKDASGSATEVAPRLLSWDSVTNIGSADKAVTMLGWPAGEKKNGRGLTASSVEHLQTLLLS